jgi:hypothetical protein
VLPFEDSKFLNLQNFSTIGSDLLKGQEAFKKVREYHKGLGLDLFSTLTDQEVFKTNLNKHFISNTSFFSSLNYGLTRQKNLFSTSSNSNTSFIDEKPSSQLLSFKKLNKLNYSEFLRASSHLIPTRLTTQHSLLPKTLFYPQILQSYPISSGNSTNPTQILPNFLEQQDALSFLKKRNVSNLFFYGARSKSLFKKNLYKPTFQIFNEKVSDAEKVLLTEQSPRYYTNLKPLKGNLNLSGSLSLTKSNSSLNNNSIPTFTPMTNYLNGGVNQINSVLVYKILTNSFYDASNTSSVLSSKPEANVYDHADISNKVLLLSSMEDSNKAKNLLSYKNTILQQKTPVTNLLTGSRERAPQILNSAYWSLY